ncbi:hypothetical protein wVul_0617 [Wolbachia endosymbiont of Armadillidium vulgare str. wVulC]|nr:hypothetical protein wVul_1548 [Wolbachia endosymbiont of Armadillidium vulgare str. wVulC]KLT23414.1 hypothetical protein wVul_0617 [Wolbachia endosymbiont of Armadillidium vulgare str. wVulC]
MLSLRSQFFHNRLHFSNQAKDLSTTHLFGNTAKVCNSLHLNSCTNSCFYLCCKIFSCIASISEYIFDFREFCFSIFNHFYSIATISCFCRCYMNCVWKTLCINCALYLKFFCLHHSPFFQQYLRF